jgi:hypothetical protein
MSKMPVHAMTGVFHGMASRLACEIAVYPFQKGDTLEKMDFWRKSNKPPFDSLQSFLGLHFTSGIIARSAASPDRAKNQPIGS